MTRGGHEQEREQDGRGREFWTNAQGVPVSADEAYVDGEPMNLDQTGPVAATEEYVGYWTTAVQVNRSMARPASRDEAMRSSYQIHQQALNTEPRRESGYWHYAHEAGPLYTSDRGPDLMHQSTDPSKYGAYWETAVKSHMRP